MKNIKRNLFSLITVVAMLSPIKAGALGSATLSMSPSTTTPNIGSSVTVSIYESGTDVNVVSVYATYDASKLTCNGVNDAGSAFANSLAASCSGGNVTISRYTAPGSPTINGSALVAKLTFTANAEGSAVLSFTSSSQIASDGQNIWNGATTGTTIHVQAAPAPTPTPTPVTPSPVTTVPTTPNPTPVANNNSSSNSNSQSSVANNTTTDANTTPTTADVTADVSDIEQTPQVEGVETTSAETPSDKVVDSQNASNSKSTNIISSSIYLLLIVALSVGYFAYTKYYLPKKKQQEAN